MQTVRPVVALVPPARRACGLAAALLMLAASLTAQSVTRGPYLQQGSDEQIVVCWRTNTASSSAVRYGTSTANLNQTASNAAAVKDHAVLLTGLSADTTYYYSVGTTTAPLAGGDADHRFVTSPPPGGTRPTRVWVLGDSGTADSSARAVRDAYYAFTGATHTDLWLMLGDNAYGDGKDSEYQGAVFEDMYEAMLIQSVLWPTLGNHDAKSADSAMQSGPYYDIFALPTAGETGGLASGTEAYYAFDFGDIHFVCLDSADSNGGPGSAMLTWLAADLASSAQDWIIAFWHHPPYTKGSHDSDDSDDEESFVMRGGAVPILEQAGVDLVLSGHSHSYERSMLIDGHYGTSNTFAPSHIVDGGDGKPGSDGAYVKDGLVGHEGSVYVVAGSSGKTGGGDLDHPVMLVSLAKLGSLVLDVNGDQLDARFLGSNGVVRDEFTIVKGGTNAQPPLAGFRATPLAGPAPLGVVFTDSSTGAVTSWSWDFGDGAVSSLSDPTHVYTQVGTYTVSLTVAGPGGQDSHVQPDLITAEVPPPPPVAAFSVQSTTGAAPFVALFSDESTGPLSAWSWDFGDGGSSDEQHPGHLYTAAGSYDVCLTVTGPGGQDTLARSGLVTVTDALPPGQMLAAIALGDKVEGQLGAGAEAAHLLRFPAVAGTVLTFVARSADGVLQPSLRLLGSSGAELVSAEDSVLSPKKAAIRKLHVERTGYQLLELRDASGQGGDYVLRSIARFPKRLVETLAVGPFEGQAELRFDALAGAELRRLVAKRLAPKGQYASVDGVPSALAPKLSALAAPGATGLLDLAEHLKTSKNGKRVTLSKLPLPAFGTYVLTLEGHDGSVGWARLLARLATPKGKATHSLP